MTKTFEFQDYLASRTLRTISSRISNLPGAQLITPALASGLLAPALQRNEPAMRAAMFREGTVIKRLIVVGLLATTWSATNANAQLLQSEPQSAQAGEQQPQPQPQATTQQIEDRARREARRFGVGVQGGVGIDPELIDLGAHATFGGIFRPNLAFRPGLELGAGEITTFFGINLDFVYAFRGTGGEEGWAPYVGAGPTFGLSHQNVNDDDVDDDDAPGRFDFSDTDFNGGLNFIVGMRQDRIFFEMKATAWGVSNIRLVAGYSF